MKTHTQYTLQYVNDRLIFEISHHPDVNQFMNARK